MRTKLTAIVVTLMAMNACVVVPVNTAPSPTSSPAEVSISTRGFEGDLNRFRASQGSGPVGRNAQLDRAAKAHADDMVQGGYFSHNSPGGPNGDNFGERSRSAGCQSRSGAENIANGQKTEAEVLAAWKNSPGHRRNMLVGSYTQYGLGRTGDIWVLVFSASC